MRDRPGKWDGSVSGREGAGELFGLVLALVVILWLLGAFK
jgi:hypothetical protein